MADLEVSHATIDHTGITGVGGGGGGYALDSYSLNGTHGDDFTAGSLSGSWTRRNFTGGAETYQLGKDATYMRVSTAGRANGDGYFRTAPGSDWTIAMAFVPRVSVGYTNVGIACVDSSGTGVVTGFYNSPSALLVMALTTYSTYGGTFAQTTARTSLGTTTQLETKQWMYLRKSGTNYYGAFSFDGEVWSDETAAFSSAHTVDRVGILLAPLGNIPGLIDIDVFNKIA
jgi:hypothetical protein